MGSCVLQSFSITHSIYAIYHLAKRLAALHMHRPIHQLHHPCSKTSWLLQWALSSVLLVITVFPLGWNSRDTTITSKSGLCISYPTARLDNFNLFTRSCCYDSGPKSLRCSPYCCGRTLNGRVENGTGSQLRQKQKAALSSSVCRSPFMENVHLCYSYHQQLYKEQHSLFAEDSWGGGVKQLNPSPAAAAVAVRHTFMQCVFKSAPRANPTFTSCFSVHLPIKWENQDNGTLRGAPQWCSG